MKFFLHSLLACFKIVRIDDAHMLDPHGTDQSLKIYMACGIALDILSCQGILLMACHPGY